MKHSHSFLIYYINAHELYVQELATEEEQDKEHERCCSKESSFFEFRNQVFQWVSLAETRLANQAGRMADARSLVSRRSRSSRRSTTSSVSARELERVRVAEMLAEKSMMKRKLELQAAEEEIKLDIEIAKAKTVTKRITTH
jgi:hypothetical protein